MRVLITNDDGIDAVGINELAAEVAAAGHEVTVAAPHVERSGASASLTAVQDDGRLIVHQRAATLPGVRMIGVEASPALIAFVAARGAFGAVPELVVSGINHGPNTGNAILHSGTVGAAFTASTHGIPALAVSLTGSKPTQFATARIAARRALDWMVEHGEPGWVLNVNVPDIPPDRLRGLRHAGLADFGAVQANIGENGEGWVTVTFAEIEAERDSSSDAALLLDDWATATVLQAPWEQSAVDISELVDAEPAGVADTGGQPTPDEAPPVSVTAADDAQREAPAGPAEPGPDLGDIVSVQSEVAADRDRTAES